MPPPNYLHFDGNSSSVYTPSTSQRKPKFNVGIVITVITFAMSAVIFICWSIPLMVAHSRIECDVANCTYIITKCNAGDTNDECTMQSFDFWNPNYYDGKIFPYYGSLLLNCTSGDTHSSIKCYSNLNEILTLDEYDYAERMAISVWIELMGVVFGIAGISIAMRIRRKEKSIQVRS